MRMSRTELRIWLAASIAWMAFLVIRADFFHDFPTVARYDLQTSQICSIVGHTPTRPAGTGLSCVASTQGATEADLARIAAARERHIDESLGRLRLLYVVMNGLFLLAPPALVLASIRVGAKVRHGLATRPA